MYAQPVCMTTCTYISFVSVVRKSGHRIPFYAGVPALVGQQCLPTDYFQSAMSTLPARTFRRVTSPARTESKCPGSIWDCCLAIQDTCTASQKHMHCTDSGKLSVPSFAVLPGLSHKYKCALTSRHLPHELP